MESLDPRAWPVVEVSKRGVDFRISMVIAARSGIPAVGARVVRVELYALDGVSSTSGALLVESAGKAVFLMPLKKRLEEGCLCERRPRSMVVVPYALRLVAVFLPQSWQVRKHVIATARMKGFGEAR